MSEERRKPQLAVALDYEVGTHNAPVVVAKGRGHIAETILDLARDNGIAIEANPMLAEALSGVEIDQSIPRELYEAVAEVIGFRAPNPPEIVTTSRLMSRRFLR